MISHLWPFKSSRTAKRRRKTAKKVGGKKFVSVAAFVYASHILWKLFFVASNSTFSPSIISSVRRFFRAAFKSPIKIHFIYWKTYYMLGVIKRLRGKTLRKPTNNKASKMKAWKTNRTNIYDLFNFRVYFYQRRKTNFFSRFLVQTHIFIVLSCGENILLRHWMFLFWRQKHKEKQCQRVVEDCALRT